MDKNAADNIARRQLKRDYNTLFATAKKWRGGCKVYRYGLHSCNFQNQEGAGAITNRNMTNNVTATANAIRTQNKLDPLIAPLTLLVP